jgi:predicted DNA-binding helix-hairpin-helix protein
MQEDKEAVFETLIRVPGIGITYAKRIMEARRHCIITHDILKKMRVSLKRSIFFITCNGKYMGGDVLFSADIRNTLATGHDELSINSSLTADEPNLCS